MFISFCTLSMALMALPSEAFGARLKETVTDGKLALVIDRERLGRGLEMGEGAERHGVAVVELVVSA